MKTFYYKEENYCLSNWLGGTTKELAIFPKQSKYIDRNFIWRLSSATVDLEESDFTKLEDYDRVLMVLEGEVVLSYENQRVSRLKALEQDRFDGAWKTKSFGKITDYNLMVRKGSEGYLDLLSPTNETTPHSSTYGSKKPMSTHGLYCKEGFFIINVNGQSQMVSSGQLFVIEGEPNEAISYSIMGEGLIIRAQIFYDDMSNELFAEEIPSEKASFDDFKKCIYLSNMQNRWSKYLSKSLKVTWYDEALTAAIKKAERFYLPYIVLVIGILALIYAYNLGLLSLEIGLISIAAWLIIHCLVISPLFYFVHVPKPVAKHIKNVNDLTPYEQKLRNEQLGINEDLEKVLKKYKNSGKNIGI